MTINDAEFHGNHVFDRNMVCKLVKYTDKNEITVKNNT